MHTYIHRRCVDVCEFSGIIEPSWTTAHAKKPKLERWAITLSRFVHKYFFPIHETRPFPLSLSIWRPAGGSELIKPKQAAPRIHADTTRRFIGFWAKTTHPCWYKNALKHTYSTWAGASHYYLIWSHTRRAVAATFFLALGARNCGFRLCECNAHTHTHESMRYMRAVIYSPGALPSLHQRSCVHRNAKIN
jgi:hypothetical protein